MTDALSLVGLADFAGRRVSELSGGQQQRVGFARAIVSRPKIVLFDEPLSALDAQLRETMRGEIKRITSALAMTSIFVTHDQEEAMSMSDRILVLNHGALEQAGSPIDITPIRPLASQLSLSGNPTSLMINACFVRSSYRNH